MKEHTKTFDFKTKVEPQDINLSTESDIIIENSTKNQNLDVKQLMSNVHSEQMFSFKKSLKSYKPSANEQKKLFKSGKHSISDIHTKKCQECGKVFATISTLDRHVMEFHERSRVFQCHICPSNFSRQEYLIMHHRVCLVF